MLAYRRRMADGGSLSQGPRTGWLVAGALVLAAVVAGAFVVACSDDSTSTPTTTEPADTTTTEPTTGTTEPTTGMTRGGPPPASCVPPEGASSGPDDLVFRPVLAEVPPGSCEGVPGWLEGDDGTWYQVGPATPAGTVESARAEVNTITGDWVVSLVFAEGRPGIDDFNELAAQCSAAGPGCPTYQIAVVVGDEVVSAPTVQAPSFERDEMEISGDFTRDTAEALAERIA
jgi:preprotein translocase subunit SecD